MPPDPTGRRIRGGLVGVTVGAVAVAAHGGAGGGYPNSAESTLLLAAGTLAGAAAALPGGRPGLLRLSGLLGAGQLAGHWALSGLLGHAHQTSGLAALLPGGWMLAAHTIATFCCAALILAAERLYSVAAGALRAVLTAPSRGPFHSPARWPDSGRRAARFLSDGAPGPRAPPAPA